MDIQKSIEIVNKAIKEESTLDGRNDVFLEAVKEVVTKLQEYIDLETL